MRARIHLRFFGIDIPTQVVARTMMGATLVFAVAMIVIDSLVLRYAHPLASLDGAMQTWFALQNFSSGAQLGHDFHSYLGVTSLLVLVPFFVVLGSNVWASTVAAGAVIAAGHLISIWGLTRLARWPGAVLRWALVAAALILLHLFGAEQLIDPGVSLRPLRWALPLLMLPVVLPALRQSLLGSASKSGAAMGLVAGFGLLWSNDSGIPVLLALLGAAVLCHLRDWRRMAVTLFSILGTAFLTATLSLLIVTRGEPLAWLRYNFVSVPSEQIWYFGQWGREDRLLSASDLWHLISPMTAFQRLSLLILLIGILVAVVRRLRGRGAPARLSSYLFVATASLGMALLPQLGGHVYPSYFYSIVMVAWASPFIVFGPQIFRALKRYKDVLLSASVIGTIALMGAVVAVQSRVTQKLIENRADEPFVDALGFHVERQIAEEMDAFARIMRRLDIDRSSGPSLLSTYTSQMNIITGNERTPTPYGSIIHALGSKARDEYVSVVAERKVSAVTIISPSYNAWGDWAMRANWPFFRALAKNYRPVARGSQHILWVSRDGEDVSEGPANCEISRMGDRKWTLHVRAGGAGMVDLGITMRIEKSLRPVIVAKERSRSARSALVREGWQGAPYYGVQPVVSPRLAINLEEGGTAALDIERYDDGSLEIESCQARLIPWYDFDALPTFSQHLIAENLREERTE
ncbi:hypothetical protein [Sphingomicrobium clamense]|uniref:Uncharacterized protein n=1 Tax=Sphingomicrobium clamense TaxID=2851013 RepID=A0ABS6V891_9SPHN|nr:hypothetical protein [Sphingomicrobium sp. B8]MBW0145802.1 hypothetical protein [Sphingomicrobium sp. B8]